VRACRLSLCLSLLFQPKGVVVGGAPTRAPVASVVPSHSAARAASHTNTPSFVVVSGAVPSPSSTTPPTPSAAAAATAAPATPAAVIINGTTSTATTTTTTPTMDTMSTTTITSPSGGVIIRPRGSLSLSTANTPPNGSGGNSTPTGPRPIADPTSSISGVHGKLSTLVIVDEYGGVRRTSAAAVSSTAGSRPVTADQKSGWLSNRQGSSDRLGESPAPLASGSQRRSMTGGTSPPSTVHRAFGRPGSLELPGMSINDTLHFLTILSVLSNACDVHRWYVSTIIRSCSIIGCP
jgi:hypothetical protein